MADSQTFSVRIVAADYYMAPPIPGLDLSYSSFHGGKVNEVPVIRIYGSTPAGQKTCLHVHQLKSKACSKWQHVHCCSLVRAKIFYGYHSSEELFVKIYLYYPHDVSRAANLLLDGGVLNKCLQSREARIPFILQFLVDYNFDGMGYIHLSKMKFLHPVPDVFSPKKSVHTDQPRKDMNPSTCTPPDSKIQVAVHLLMHLFGYLPWFQLIGCAIFVPILMSQQIQISTPLNVKVFVQSRGM